MKGKSMSLLKGRIVWILCFFAGWLVASISVEPRQVLAETRTSLASLQAAIESIINGTQLVGHADDADNLDGFPGFAYSMVGDPVRLTSVVAPATAANSGTLRWNAGAGKVEVSDGIQWVALN
jgi:hypothetical protein